MKLIKRFEVKAKVSERQAAIITSCYHPPNFSLCYRRSGKVNLSFIVCFPLVKGSFVEMFRNDEGLMTAFFVIFAFGCGHGTCECCPMYDFVIIRVHFNTILASFSFLILFNFRTVPGPRRPYFSRFSILPFASASVKCIAAMNFIYSTDPFPILFWKFMMRGYSKI